MYQDSSEWGDPESSLNHTHSPKWGKSVPSLSTFKKICDIFHNLILILCHQVTKLN